MQFEFGLNRQPPHYHCTISTCMWTLSYLKNSFILYYIYATNIKWLCGNEMESIVSEPKYNRYYIGIKFIYMNMRDPNPLGSYRESIRIHVCSTLLTFTLTIILFISYSSFKYTVFQRQRIVEYSTWMPQ